MRGEKLIVIEIMIVSKDLVILIDVEMNRIEHKRNQSGWLVIFYCNKKIQCIYIECRIVFKLIIHIYLLKDGPTSQHDTIELRGFEDPPTDKSKKKKTKPGKWTILVIKKCMWNIKDYIFCLATRAKKPSIDSLSAESGIVIKGANESKPKKTKKEKEEDKKKKSSIDKSNVKFFLNQRFKFF